MVIVAALLRRTRTDPSCGSRNRSAAHLAAVFLLFFALVVILGAFSIWRLSNFDAVVRRRRRSLAADDARARRSQQLHVGLPRLRGQRAAVVRSGRDRRDRAANGGTRSHHRRMPSAASNASARRGGERSVRPVQGALDRLSHHRQPDAGAGRAATARPKRWRSTAASSRAAYNAASDTLGQLTDQAVASAQTASDRLAVAYRQAFWLILLAIVIAAVLVVAALIHISRSISAPLLDLADRMRRLAANDTDIDIPETERRDEIGEMAQATVVFRNNAIELMRSQRVLARQAALLEEQLAHEQRLALLQRNFVSMASHEFRTPLTVIDGHARRLDKIKRRGEAGRDRRARRQDPQRRAAHDPSDRQSAQLVAPDRRRRRALFPSRGNGHDALCCRRSANCTARWCRPRRSSSDFPPRRCRWSATPSCCFRSFSNLLSNAIKYSPGGGAIEVEAQGAADEVVVAIADRGIGIPADDLDRCSSAITAAAMSPVSSAPGSVFTSSRWRSSCTTAASRWKARRARARALQFTCREGLPHR